MKSLSEELEKISHNYPSTGFWRIFIHCILEMDHLGWNIPLDTLLLTAVDGVWVNIY
jgi:hypothetical protein